MTENKNLIERCGQNLKLRTLKNTCAGVTLTTTNTIWIRLEMNLACRADSQNPANTDLSDATHPPNVSESCSRLFNKLKEGSVIVAFYMPPEDI